MKQLLMTFLDVAVLTLILWVLHWVGFTEKPEAIDLAMVLAISALYQQHGRVSK